MKLQPAVLFMCRCKAGPFCIRLHPLQQGVSHGCLGNHAADMIEPGNLVHNSQADLKPVSNNHHSQKLSRWPWWYGSLLAMGGSGRLWPKTRVAYLKSCSVLCSLVYPSAWYCNCRQTKPPLFECCLNMLRYTWLSGKLKHPCIS